MSESVKIVPPFAPASEIRISPGAPGPTTREWIQHSFLFLLTFFTTTFAGILIAAPKIDVPPPAFSGVVGYILYIPEYYLRIVSALLSFAVLNPGVLTAGLTFSASLL